MTKTMKNKLTPTRRRSGFTLIEMLVVAALIAIFAGLAVFNIVEQLNREKEKAALAEARSIATAMSFAYDDMGFFPKLCFLRFGVDELLRVISNAPPDGKNLPSDAIDYFSFGSPTMANMIKSNWGEKYMAGSMPDKYVNMQLGTSTGVKEFQWPADPFRMPYVAYLTKVETDATGNSEINWLESFGEKANYFAGIVSYGRNKVPGLTWDETDETILLAPRRNLSLFQATPDSRTFQLPRTGIYTPAALQMLTGTSNDPINEPYIRDVGSDDKYFEF